MKLAESNTLPFFFFLSFYFNTHIFYFFYHFITETVFKGATIVVDVVDYDHCCEAPGTASTNSTGGSDDNESSGQKSGANLIVAFLLAVTAAVMIMV